MTLASLAVPLSTGEMGERLETPCSDLAYAGKLLIVFRLRPHLKKNFEGLPPNHLQGENQKVFPSDGRPGVGLTPLSRDHQVFVKK